MAAHWKTLTWLLLAVVLSSRAANVKHDSVESSEGKGNGTGVGEILKASETADPKKVEIVKQIRRLNNDGSYTVGYEAGDGTFKIESRDVLGNVKGTFGYIDGDGEIKRVTYSSSNSSTPVPVTASTGSTTVPPVAKSVSSTTRRPLATVVYPRGSPSTRGTVIQPIPRKRPSTVTISGHSSGMDSITDMTDNPLETTTSNILNLYKPKLDEALMKPMKMPVMKHSMDSAKEILQTKQTSTEGNMRTLHTVKPVHEHVTEKEFPTQSAKVNQFRRQLSGTSHDNPQMLSLQQSIGDDSTDVYGNHLSLGTVRPLFTTTTTRPRLVPFTSILASRQKLQEHIQRAPGIDSEHETTVEASTGRVFDHENVVTSNPVPFVHIPTHRDRSDERLYQQPIYRRPYTNVQFRTTEYLRDNPGAPIPIGNQRPYLNLDYRSQQQETDPQFLRETTPQPAAATAKSVPSESITPAPYGLRPVTRIIPIAVDERGVPIPGYRFTANPFDTPTSPAQSQSRPPYIQSVDNEMNSITTPVSTRDLRKLLHILLIRQNRLQALMDEVSNPGPPYRSLPLYRVSDSYDRDYSNKQVAYPVPPPANLAYQNYVQPRQYNLIQPSREPPQYNNYRSAYEQPAYDNRQQVSRQQELFTNQISGYESSGQYESQRFVPRRRLYSQPQYDHQPYDTDGANSNQVSDTPTDYLPADVREALLLKMLMLAISPEYVPVPGRGGGRVPLVPDAPAPLTELTTAAPIHRKQVRNVQILGEEGSKDDMNRRAMQAH